MPLIPREPEEVLLLHLRAMLLVVFRAASPETEGDDTDFEVDTPVEETQVRVVRTFPKTN